MVSLPLPLVCYPYVEVSSLQSLRLTASKNRDHLTDYSIDGLDMIKEVFNASQTLELAVGRVELQKDVSKPPFRNQHGSDTT